MTHPRHAISAALLAAAALLPACASDPTQGYSFASTYDASVRTIAVPVFANTTCEPGIEAELTEAIVKRIQRDTPWKVTASDTAETVLTGTIPDVELRALSRTSGTGLVQEVTHEITVDFAWRDNRAGQTLAERRNFAGVGAFVPDRLTGERIAVGRREAIDELARDIVAELRADW
mgnify:CR=1 FL=1